MATFTLRDLRIPRVDEALAALPDDSEVRPRLESERQALSSDDWFVEDRTMLAVTEDFLRDNGPELRAGVEADPVLIALGTPAQLSDAQATAAAALVGDPAADFLDRVRAALDGDEATFTEVVHAAWSAWMEGDRHPFDDVGVLLPLRLETLFDAPGSEFNEDPERWKLSLRVMPDEASICRDDAHVSSGELAATRAFWTASRQAGAFDATWLDGDAAVVAWQQLCHQVAPARAAWLMTHLVPEVDGDALVVEPPEDMPPDPQPNRVGGLPPELTVWGITLDETRHAVGRLPMDPDATISADALALPLPDRADTARDAWWASWTTAVQVGLAGEWLLEAGVTPESLATLYVLGLGDESPDEHFRSQVDAGELGVLRLGAPTNAVHGAPAADLATDAEAWRAIARERLSPSGKGVVGASIAQHLTGSADALAFFPAGDAPDDTLDSKRMAQALWPALLGHWLADVWEVGEDAFRANQWAFPLFDDAVPSPPEIRDVLRRDPKDPDVLVGDPHFAPEGPLMPLRIGDQPYGLLPVTALSRWRPADAETAAGQEQARVEDSAALALSALRSQWAARSAGTVVGAGTDRFMELLSRDALSGRYGVRSFMPASAWASPYGFDPDERQQFDDTVSEIYRRVSDLVGTSPATLHLTNGYWRANRLPLVQPTRTLHTAVRREAQGRVALTEFLSLLLDNNGAMDLVKVFERFWVLVRGGEFQLRGLPDSLLIRLLVHATQIDADWLDTQTGGDLALQVLRGQVEAVRSITRELDQPDWNPEDRDPETGEPLFRIVVPDARRVQLERALRATLDSSAHRIDPWVTGFAWQRLKVHSASRRHAHRLGAYGWVDGPFLGEPGPTEAGRLHTASYNQTIAAIVLRDKFLSSGRAGGVNDAGNNPWEMNISSRRARLAEEIADEVRLGFHTYEIVGRHVENVVADHQSVKALRTSPSYAMRDDRLDPHEVCNGIDALKGLLAGDPQFPLEATQIAALQELHDSLATYSDLLMADGVMQLVNRQPDRAAETMDAAAGFSRPPTFEFLRTPTSGYQLESLVLATLPYVGIDDVPLDAGPIRLADPSLAAFVEETVGVDWTWTVLDHNDDTEIARVGLGELGLAAVDTMTLSVDLLADLVLSRLGLSHVFVTEEHNRQWVVKDAAGAELGSVRSVDLPLPPVDLAGMDHDAVLEAVRDRAGAPADSLVEEATPADLRLWVASDEHGRPQAWADLARLGLTSEQVDALETAELHRAVRRRLGLPDPVVEPPAQHTQIQHLAAALGNRPAAGRDLIQDESTQRATDAAIYQELADRYTALHVAGRTLVADLRAADEDARQGLLLRALSWGISPVSAPADRDALLAAVSGREAPTGATAVADLAEAAAQALEQRLDSAPQPADLAPAADLSVPLADHQERKRGQRPDGVPTLAEAIANLASPQGKLTVTACWQRADLVADTALEVGATEPSLDETWLTVVAAVRPTLARLEALQLGLAAPLESWSSSPDDPFRTGVDQAVRQNLRTRTEESVTKLALNDRFVAAYGRAGAWEGPKVAVGLVDSFSEAIPMPQRSTSAAFGFNAPAARAPQAILLAVPPQPRQRIDEELLLQILVETRELAHARTAHLEDLGDLQTLAPTSWLQSSGPARVRLEPYPLFT